MSTARSDYDVAVIGGGPAGATAATLLARAGRRVAVCEREHFPRYHIGESLLSATLAILAHTGALPKVERAGFVKKGGGTFLWGASSDVWSFWFRDDPGGYEHAYQVLRSEFDTILLRHAAEEGADVREGCTVERIQGRGPFRVRTRDDAGDTRTIEARYVVDASGQQALVGRRERLREFNPFFKNLALWSYFADAGRLPEPASGNILSAAHDEGWCWYIPLHDGTVSLGAVVDSARWRTRARGKGLQATYASLIDRCQPVREMIAGARQVAPVRVIRDYSYSSRRFFTDGTLLAGDAACFIDPVFSTGVHLACLSGVLAADCLDRTLAAPEQEGDSFAAYDAHYRRAFERYRKFVTFFYNHHAAADSYFWQARKLIDPSGSLELREAFVRLIAGTGDLAAEAESIAATDARWTESLATSRPEIAPGMNMIRVITTLNEMRRNGRKES